MAFPTATGNNAPNQHPTELLFDPRRGMSFRQLFTCGLGNTSGINNLLGLLQQAQRLGGSGKMVFSGAKPSLEYELPGVPSNLPVTELFFDDWQMQIDDLTNTIFTNTVLGSNLLYNDRMVLQRYMKLGSSTSIEDVVISLNVDVNATDAAGNASPAITPPNPTNGGSATTGPTGYYQFQQPSAANGAFYNLAAEVFKMIDKDQTEFLDPLPVLHHTTACSPGATYNATRANEMCIYTTAQLLSECGSGWTYNLPGRIYSELAAFPTRTAPPDEAAFFTWGWLKTRQTQATQTNFMIEVHQEYKLNLWPNIYYALHP